MKGKIRWHTFLLVGLALSLAIPLGACAKVSPVESYLADTEAIINEATEIAAKVSNLYETTDLYSKSEIVEKCANYGKEYDDLLLRFTTLEYPHEALKFRKYVIDGLTSSKQEVTEFGAAFATGDIEHLYKAESYYSEAQKALALAAAEWERLASTVEQEGGIGILEIFLGLLALGVVVVIAMFVLELTLGVGFGIIAGIGAAIGAIVQKIKGSDKEWEQEQAKYIPLPEISEKDFVGNKKTRIFHRLDCYQAQQISYENEARFESAADAIIEGYEPCKLCNPE